MISPHCTDSRHSVCLRYYGGAFCECVCHVAMPVIIDVEPPSPFTVVATSTYDGDTDTLDVTPTPGYERAIQAMLHPEPAPRMFRLSLRSTYNDSPMEVDTQQPIEAVKGQLDALWKIVLDGGHRDIHIEVEELPF